MTVCVRLLPCEGVLLTLLVADPTRPKTMGFVGSEDYIRLQFEEYILSMVSAVKYHLFLEKNAGKDSNVFLADIGTPEGGWK